MAAHRVGADETSLTVAMDVQLRLSIWRDYTPPRPLALRDDQVAFQAVIPENRLQEEVYSWPLYQDAFAGIQREDIRSRLRKQLDSLDVSHPPAERTLTELDKFVTAAEKVIAANEAASVPWESGSMTVEINPLLALMLHMKWLLRCFKDRPGISVSKR